ncbi:MAG: CoA pyrophosphatase [Candidatus Bathyarchaeum tardum]|nr:MAG: CoA pyrophosphatase [Candidatus Bathyarchaeum tardum]
MSLLNGASREQPKLNATIIAERLSKTLIEVDSLDVNAAVAVLLRENNHALEILFVKRTETPKDPWSGQTAFPGGKRCSEDKDLRDTVIRETCEETNINLRNGCKFLGTLTPITSIQRPDIRILPFVVLQLEEQPIKLNNELSNFFWVPLTELTKTNGTKQYMSKDYPAYVIKTNVVWGITYQITNYLISMLQPF